MAPKTCIQYPNAGEFLDRTRGFLEADEVLYSRELGVAQSVVDGRVYGPEKPTFYTVEEGTKILAIGLQTPPYPCFLVCPEGDSWTSIADRFQNHDSPPKAVVALTPLARAYCERRVRQTGETPKVRFSQRSHVLRQVTFPKNPPPGLMRQATQADADLLRPWVFRFGVDCGITPIIDAGIPEIVPHLAEGNIYLWQVEGDAVACAALSRESPNGHSISFVYTPDDQRGRGYASMLVATLSQWVLDRGKSFCTLNTDLANPTSNKIYAAVGYRPVDDFQVIEFHP